MFATNIRPSLRIRRTFSTNIRANMFAQFRRIFVVNVRHICSLSRICSRRIFVQAYELNEHFQRTTNIRLIRMQSRIFECSWGIYTWRIFAIDLQSQAFHLKEADALSAYGIMQKNYGILCHLFFNLVQHVSALSWASSKLILTHHRSA